MRLLVVEPRRAARCSRRRPRSRCAWTTKKLVDRPTSNLLCLGLEPPLRQLAGGAGGVDALLVALDVQRGVGDLGGDLQLEGADLRLRLPHRDLRARVVGVGRAGADRVGHVQRQVPLREVAVAQQAQRVGVAAGNRVDDLAAQVAVADQLRAADALQAVAGRESTAGSALVAQQRSDRSLAASCLRDCARSSARVERAAQRRLRGRSASARSAGRSVGAQLGARQRGSSVPPTISRFSASSRGAGLRLALRHRPAAASAASASACTTSIGASVPTSTRMRLSSTSLRRELERAPRHLQLVDGVDVVPVGVADVGQRVGDGRRAAAAR